MKYKGLSIYWTEDGSRKGCKHIDESITDDQARSMVQSLKNNESVILTWEVRVVEYENKQLGNESAAAELTGSLKAVGRAIKDVMTKWTDKNKMFICKCIKAHQ